MTNLVSESRNLLYVVCTAIKVGMSKYKESENVWMTELYLWQSLSCHCYGSGRGLREGTMLAPHPPTGPFNSTFMQQRRTAQSRKKYDSGCLLLLHDNTTNSVNKLKVPVYVLILWLSDCLVFS